jgi:hypothetical protein
MGACRGSRGRAVREFSGRAFVGRHSLLLLELLVFGAEGQGPYMWASFRGTIKRSSPTNALPVAMILFSPSVVNGSSVVPVCRPLRDHSVSPWRTMKTLGVVIEKACQEFGLSHTTLVDCQLPAESERGRMKFGNCLMARGTAWLR